jgi:hypothetical protein
MINLDGRGAVEWECGGREVDIPRIRGSKI